ncbi:36963_t:CDS:2, partial [Gigaspora margarita]
PKREQLLYKKELWSCISNFLTETIESFKDKQGKAHVIIVLGYIGVFAFNNATSHIVLLKSAFVASIMKLGPEA